MSYGRGRRQPHARNLHWRSLSTAFMVWFERQDEVFRSEVIATKRQSRIVLRFSRFPMLSGWVRNHCLAVEARDDRGDYYDCIFDLDSLPLRVEGTMKFVCGFCVGERREFEFESREALFIDHLFNPFGEWVRTKLKRATGVEYLRIEGMTSAKLRLPGGANFSDDAEVNSEGGATHFRIYRQVEPR